MKKIVSLLLSLMICFLLTACKGEEKTKNDSTESVATSEPESVTEETEKKSQTKELTMEEMEEQLNEQEIKIVSSEYIVQDNQYKNLYPDALQVVLENNTQYDIKNAVVAFVAWDENDLPVKIKGKHSVASKAAYIQLVDYNDINLIPGGTFGENTGYQVDEDCEISKFKSIVVSYETFTGEKWKNPLYENWKNVYEGVKLVEE